MERPEPAENSPVPRRGRPPKTVAERDEGNRRQSLIGAAAKLFRTKGFDATSTRDIAAAADMQSGSPFYFFQSKQALLHAVMEEGMARVTVTQTETLKALGAGASAHDKLRALIRHHFEVLLGPNSDFIPVMLYEWRSLTPEQRTEVTQLKDAYESVWIPVLRALHRAGEIKARPTAARLLIFGALHWAVQWYSVDGPMTLDEISAQAMKLFTGEA